MRTLERSIRAPSYQAPSSWRISRRMTSSRVSRVAVDVDAPDVDAPARIDEERERGLQLVAVDLRDRVDVGERVAVAAQPVADRLRSTAVSARARDVSRLRS